MTDAVGGFDIMSLALGQLTGNQLLTEEQLGKYNALQQGNAQSINKTGIKAQDVVLKGSRVKHKVNTHDQPRVGGKNCHLGPPQKGVQSGKNHWMDLKDVEGKIHVLDSKGNKLMEPMSYEDTELTGDKLKKINDLEKKSKTETAQYAKERGWFKDEEGVWKKQGLRNKMADWEKNAPQKAQAFADANGMRKVGDEWQMSTEANALNVTSVGGAMSSTTNQSDVMNMLGKNSWLMSAMGDADAAAFMSGGAGGADFGSLFGGAGASSVLVNGGGGLTAGLMVGGMMGSGMAGAALEGMAFHMKKQMRRRSYNAQDNAMIAMINNPGIPIEDLIFMFMAHMSDRYEQKLRDKMEESARAEKRENERERLKEKGNFLGGLVAAGGSGLVGMINPGLAIGAQMGGQMIKTYYDGKIAMQDAVGGHTKGATQLANEVQMLLHKWKQMNELMSNLMKAMHDMAMTPIRNIR